MPLTLEYIDVAINLLSTLKSELRPGNGQGEAQSGKQDVDQDEDQETDQDTEDEPIESARRTIADIALGTAEQLELPGESA